MAPLDYLVSLTLSVLGTHQNPNLSDAPAAVAVAHKAVVDDITTAATLRMRCARLAASALDHAFALAAATDAPTAARVDVALRFRTMLEEPSVADARLQLAHAWGRWHDVHGVADCLRLAHYAIAVAMECAPPDDLDVRPWPICDPEVRELAWLLGRAWLTQDAAPIVPVPASPVRALSGSHRVVPA